MAILKAAQDQVSRRGAIEEHFFSKSHYCSHRGDHPSTCTTRHRAYAGPG